jgi:signal transduction histidine kinase
VNPKSALHAGNSAAEPAGSVSGMRHQSDAAARATSGAPVDEITPGNRIRIVIARFVGAGFIAFLLVSVSEIAEGTRILAWWWTPIAMVSVFVPGIALFVVTIVAPSWITAAATCAAVGIPLAAALWLVAWNGDVLVGAVRGSWLSAFAGLAGLCAALVWRPLVTLAVQFVATTSVAAIDQLGLFGPEASPSAIGYAAIWAFGITALLAGAVIMALRTGDVLDATTELVERAAVDTAVAQARERERAWFDALIHDRVLTTLLAATRPDTDRRLPADARSALDALDLAAKDTDPAGRVTAAQLVDTLSTIVDETRSDHAVSVSSYIDVNASMYPMAVQSALGGAMAEALRNSVQHAGAHAERAVAVDLRQNSARVTLTDTGCGFDTASTGTGRLGIEISIVRRMAALDGGTSEIDSRLGEGTVVALEWSRIP